MNRIKKEEITGHFNGDYLPFYSKYLPNLKKSKGDQYQCLCIFHEDTNPSLSVNTKTGQYYCHGCGAKGDIFSFYAARNGLNGNFQAILGGMANDHGIAGTVRPKQVARYIYMDAEGNPLHSAVRTDPKGFYQEKFKDGRWINGLKGVRTVLYRLSQVIVADEVIIVEGEKDADALSEKGFPATTCPMGAGKWKDDYNQYLKGKNIVLIPDNDNEGRKHMAKVATSLQGIAASIKLIELPDLPEKGDVSDYLEKFKSNDEAAERLSILLEQAEPYRVKEPEENLNFVFIHNADIVTSLKPPQWRIHAVMEENTFYYNFGDAGNYKTFVEIDRLLHIATGIDYHGHAVKQGTIFYIAGEGQQGIGRRLAAWHIHYKTKAKDVPFFIAKTPTQLMDKDAIDEVKRAVDHLSATYGPPAIVHIDTLARNFGDGDENSTKDMNRVISNLDTCFGSDIGRGLTHHTGHGNKDRARGSYALHCAADAAYRISYRSDGMVLVESQKMKDAPLAAPMLFSRVEIKLDIQGQLATSYVLELESEGDDIPAEDQQKGMSGNMLSALEILKEMYAECEKNLADDGRAAGTDKT